MRPMEFIESQIHALARITTEGYQIWFEIGNLQLFSLSAATLFAYQLVSARIVFLPS